jgi:hypothetical protein
MNMKLAHLLTRLYPGPWRERYGAEFEALLQNSPVNLRTLANVTRGALSERVFPTLRENMNQPTINFVTKQPSAFLPMAMSLTALAMVLGKIGVDMVEAGHILREVDEGAIAHLWQLLMAGQVPILAFFALKWLPKSRGQALKVLALQAGAVGANLAVVFFSGLG